MEFEPIFIAIIGNDVASWIFRNENVRFEQTCFYRIIGL